MRRRILDARMDSEAVKSVEKEIRRRDRVAVEAEGARSFREWRKIG